MREQQGGKEMDRRELSSSKVSKKLDIHTDEVNAIFVHLGYQVSVKGVPGQKWKLTKAGEQAGKEVPGENDGGPYKFIVWYPHAVDEARDAASGEMPPRRRKPSTTNKKEEAGSDALLALLEDNNRLAARQVLLLEKLVANGHLQPVRDFAWFPAFDPVCDAGD